MSQNVNVNLVPGNYPKEFHVSQYDVGRQLVANIVDSTGAYSIPSGATVTLVGTKPSGFGFTLTGSVGAGGVVTFSTTATVTAEYGRIPCEIRIESGNTVLGTANCMLIVEMSPHPEGTTDGDGEVIVNQITLLLEQITQQADRAVAASEAAQASETAAAASEANAATSESNAAASEATALSAKDDAVAAKTAAQASEQAAAESAAEAEATLGSYAKVGGEYDGMTVGTAKQLLSDSTTTDTEPYIYRQTAGDADREEVEEVVGGTVAWNQQAPNTELTGAGSKPSVSGARIVKGHKYLFGAYLDVDEELSTNAYISPYGFDDEGNVNTFCVLGGRSKGDIYKIGECTVRGVSDGTGTNVDGNFWFFMNAQTGSFKNLKLFDLTQMFGATIADYIYSLEQATAGAGVAWFKALFPKAYYPYNAGELMSVKTSAHVTTGFNQWDEEWESGIYNVSTGAKQAFSSAIRCKNLIKVLPSTAYYIKAPNNLVIGEWSDESTYTANSFNNKNAIFTTRATTHYISFYTAQTTYKSDICINISDPSKNGTYEPYNARNYPLSPIDLRGVPKWVDGKLKFDGDVYEADGKVTRNTVYRAYQSGDESLANAITDGSHTVVYSANASTETADPYTAIQVCDPNGTEEWIDERTVPIPVGNVTKYHANLKEKLEEMPAIPTAPSANGTYTLKATVSDGAVTYQWVNG